MFRVVLQKLFIDSKALFMQVYVFLGFFSRIDCCLYIWKKSTKYVKWYIRKLKNLEFYFNMTCQHFFHWYSIRESLEIDCYELVDILLWYIGTLLCTFTVFVISIACIKVSKFVKWMCLGVSFRSKYVRDSCIYIVV